MGFEAQTKPARARATPAAIAAKTGFRATPYQKRREYE